MSSVRVDQLGFWSEDPTVRLKVARKLGEAEKSAIQRKVSAGCPVDPWPYGMPTSANPMVVVLGPSPGNSPSAGDKDFYLRRPYDLPAIGQPHRMLFYQDPRGFFAKIRALASGILGQIYGLNERDALSLAGLLNLDTGAYGDSSHLTIDDEFLKWVMHAIAESLRPEFLICLGLKGRIQQILHLIAPDADHRRPDRVTTFQGYQVKALRYEEWTIRRPDGGKMRVVLWPQHPSRPPFSSGLLWKKSVDEYARSVLATD